MPKPPRTYTRLTRPTTSVGTYKSLWLASDHLMIVTSSGFNEEYQRLEFRNLKGFFIVGSDRRMLWSLPWIIVALFSAVPMVDTLYYGRRPYVSGTFLALSAIFLLWNHLLGPGCVVKVITGVQTTALPSLVRLRKARRILRRLEPVVAATQADLVVEAPAVPPVPAHVQEPGPPPPP